MSINKEGMKAVQAVQNKIKNKFFSEKVSVSMLQTDKDSDTKTIENLKVGETYKDRNGKEWTRDENGTIKSIAKFIGKYTKPMFCPDCKRIMRGKADDRMWVLRGKCHVCVIDEEAKIRQAGKWEEYQKSIIEGNANAWIKDMEVLAKDWLETQSQEQVQFIMNSEGEMETWDTKNSEDKGLTDLNKNIKKVKKQLEENQNEV
tara:strand:- start:172 stop:780 length:609 start_codon:yes stop_codon:yes gene_type:complete